MQDRGNRRVKFSVALEDSTHDNGSCLTNVSVSELGKQGLQAWHQNAQKAHVKSTMEAARGHASAPGIVDACEATDCSGRLEIETRPTASPISNQCTHTDTSFWQHRHSRNAGDWCVPTGRASTRGAASHQQSIVKIQIQSLRPHAITARHHGTSS